MLLNGDVSIGAARELKSVFTQALGIWQKASRLTSPA